MAKHNPNQDPIEEVKFISPFVSHRFPCETERPLSPSLELESYPSSHQNIVLDSGRDSTLPLQDITCKKENSAMDIPVAPTLESKRKDYTYEMKASLSKHLLIHAHFWSLQSSCCLGPRDSTRIASISWSSSPNFLRGWLSMLLFFISIANPVVALWHSPCSMNDNTKSLVVKLGTKPPLIAAGWSCQGRACDHKQSTAGRYPRLS